MKFQMIKSKMLRDKDIACFKLSDIVLSMLINVKMPTTVGVLTFISIIISCSVELSMENVL